MIASSLCRVVATACARRPASWVTFKSPVVVVVRHPLHHIRIHPDEAEQDYDIESIRERPASIQEYEDQEMLESFKPYQRPNIRLSEATAKTKPIELKDSLADHYPIITFPFKVTTTVMETLHKLFEECCYQFALVHIPHHLAEQNWDCPEAVELTTWHKTFTELLQTHPNYVYAFDTGSTFKEAVPASRRVTHVCNHLLNLKDIRNQAAHPRFINPMALPQILRRAGDLARLFRDRRLQQDIQQLSSEIQRVLTALKTRRAESLKTGRTFELYHQIVADKVALQRVRDLLTNQQVPASSQEHWTPYAMFEKDIESLLEALPVAIQADEEARLDAELPPLVEMAEKMAAEVEKRNAEMQLRLEAVRKSRADMVLGKMQFLLNMHASRMRNNSFPFLDRAETYERQGHREQQEDGKPGFGPPGSRKASYAYRSIIRNALSQDLRRQEREFEREQANADAGAHGDALSMSAEEERFRPGSVPSAPEEEEMWSDEAMSESVSGDRGPDGYHMTTSGFFEMLEKRNKLPLEDFKQRAMKEMAAAAVEATGTKQEGEKVEQVDARESRRITTEADEIMIKSLNDEFEALSEENLMKKGISRRVAGIALRKRRLALEKKCTRLRTAISREMDLLWDERCRIMDEMKVLNVEIRRLKKEKKTARGAAKHQQQQQVGENEEEVEEEVDENTNEVEPEPKPEPTAAAVDNVVVDDSEVAHKKSIRALTELCTKKQKTAARYETLTVRKRSIKTVLKKLKKLELGRSGTVIKIGHTEEPSSHLEDTDVDVDTSMDIDVELTEAEAEHWRSRIVEEAVNADIKGVRLFISSGKAAMKAFHNLKEVLEEATGPVVTTGDEVIPAEEVATPETSITEPFDTESSTPIIASSADSEPVGPQEVSREETALSSDLVDDSVVQSAVLHESTPVQDAPAEEVAIRKMQSDEETPSLFLPAPRPRRGRSLTNLALYVSRRRQLGVDVTEDLEEGAKNKVDEDMEEDLNEDLKDKPRM